MQMQGPHLTCTAAAPLSRFGLSGCSWVYFAALRPGSLLVSEINTQQVSLLENDANITSDYGSQLLSSSPSSSETMKASDLGTNPEPNLNKIPVKEV